MESPKVFFDNTAHEVNLKVLAQRLLEKIPLFFLSAAVCIALSYLYLQIATPVYQARASLILDRTGAGRQLGRSEALGGKFNLIETKKNLHNEKGILQSYELVQETMKELDFEVSYHAGAWYKSEEHYGGFPFVVELADTSAQLFEAPFRVEILSGKQYRLSIEAKRFSVSNPANNTIHEVLRRFSFSQTFSFGEPVIHDYFHFTLNIAPGQKGMEKFQDKKLFFRIHSLESLTRAYLEKLEIQVAVGADIIKLKAKGAEAQKEIAFLEALSNLYIRSKLREREAIATRKEDFIREQLAGISDSLAQAERVLESFKKNSRAVSLAKLASRAFYKIGRLESSRVQSEWEIKYFQSLLGYLGDSSRIDKVIAPAAMGIKDPLLNENLQKLQQLYAERSRQSYFKGPKSYEIQSLDQQIKAIALTLQENLKKNIEAAELSLGSLDSELVKLENTLLQLPSREKQLGFYQRKADLYQNLYKYLSQELAKTGIAKAEDVPDIRVLEKARTDGEGPVSPQERLVYLIGILISLAIPFGWIVIRYTLDDTIKNVETLEAYSDIPVAASVAHLNTQDLSMWQVQESFRDLNARLPMLVEDRGRNVIGLSSTIPSEGKTFCAFHLAQNIAMAGKSVLLMDADFRVPSQIKEKVEIRQYGLSDYLMDGHLSEEDIIHADENLPGLYYLPTRIEDRNPQAILGSPRLKPLILKMKAQYDYIIVDSPAMGLVSDYLLLAPLIDIHLFILRRNYSRLSFLPALEKLREKGNIEHLYLVLNDVPGKSFKYGYYQKEHGYAQWKRGLALTTKH